MPDMSCAKPPAGAAIASASAPAMDNIGLFIVLLPVDVSFTHWPPQFVATDRCSG